MSIMKAVADYFKSATKTDGVDRYGILSPLLATGDYVTSTQQLFTVLEGSAYKDLVIGKIKSANVLVEKGVSAYKDYVQSLPTQDRERERAKPFSTITLALQSINGNIAQIEDNFQAMFGDLNKEAPEQSLKSSSLMVMGYLEKSENFATWLCVLVEHLTAKDGDMIPPFRTKEMQSKARDAGTFAGFNLNRWSHNRETLLGEIKEMQKKGADLPIQAQDGTWIDDMVHDNQFSPVEQDLMVSAMRSPVLMIMNWGLVKTQNKIDLLEGRKNWLTSKIILEQAKLRGMDDMSPEYKRIKSATDHYADLVSRYEQKIERLRA